MIARIWTIVWKELADVCRSRLILTTLIVPTVLYVVISLAALSAGSLPGLAGIPRTEIEALERSMPQSSGVPPIEAFQVLMVDQILVLYMLAPLFIPLTVASYSIIGEKQLRTLEPLLATPVRTWELLAAKSIAAIVPGICVSWASYLAFLTIAGAIASPGIVRHALNPMWLVAFGVLAPLFALLAVAMAVIASSRTNDPRAAQQLGAVVILPISALLSAQVFGFVRLDLSHAVAISVAVAAIDVVLLWIAVRLFDRETILTRWR